MVLDLGGGCGCKKLEEDTARTADPHWPKGCPTRHSVMLNNETGGVFCRKLTLSQLKAGQ